MPAVVWILAVGGAGWAWICVLAAGMSTVPRFRSGAAAGAIAPSALGLALAWFVGAQDGWGAGLIAATTLTGLTIAFVILSFFTQPSPPAWTRRLRRLLRLGDGLPGQRVQRLATPWGEVRIRDFRREEHARAFGVPPAVSLGEGSSSWGYGVELRPVDRHRAPTRTALEAKGVLTCLGSWSLAVENELLIVALCDYVIALDLPSLAVAWTLAPDVGMTALYRDVDATGRLVCIGDAGLCAIGPDGRVEWRQRAPRTRQDPKLRNGRVYMPAIDGGYLVVRVEDGQCEGIVDAFPEPTARAGT